MDGPYNGPVYITFIYNLNMEDLVMSITKEELDKYIELYSQGKPTGLTDEEYDRLLEEYLKEHGGESARQHPAGKRRIAPAAFRRSH